jgi:hypothetical protein
MSLRPRHQLQQLWDGAAGRQPIRHVAFFRQGGQRQNNHALSHAMEALCHRLGLLPTRRVTVGQDDHAAILEVRREARVLLAGTAAVAGRDLPVLR